MATPSTSLVRKTIHTFGTLLFSQGANFASGIALARTFGPSGKGVVSFAAVLLMFAGTTGEGLRSALAFQIGRHGVDARSALRSAAVLGAIIAALGSAILVLLGYLTHERAYPFAAVAFPFAIYSQVAGMIYQIRDRVESINVKNAATVGGGSAILSLALVLIFHANLTIVLCGWVAMYAIAAIWITIGLGPMIGREEATHPFGSLVKQQLAFGSKAALSSNVTYLALRIDVFIVSAMMAPAALGIYTLALALGEIMWSVSRSVFWSTAGRIVTLPLPEASALASRVVRSVIALGCAGGLVLFIAAPPLIAHVYGARFAQAGTVLRILLPGMILYSADGMLSFFIAVRNGRPGLLLGLECVTLVICGTVTYATIGRFGIYGAATADTVAYLVSYALKVSIFMRLSGVPLRDLLILRSSDVPERVLGGVRRALHMRPA